MNVNSFTITGQKSEKVTVPEAVFGVKVDKNLLALAVRVFLANQRKAISRTKTRGEVAKTTAKMYKQKGTGRARHGSYSAPIFVGGGISHGPDGSQNYTLKMTKSVKKLALREALSAKAKEGKITIISGADKAIGKTQEIAKLVKSAGYEGTVLAIGTKDQVGWFRSWKNIKKSVVCKTNQINPYLILVHKNLVLTSEAVKEISKNYAN